VREYNHSQSSDFVYRLKGSVAYAQYCPSVGERLSAFAQGGSRETTILCATVFRPFITVFDGFSGHPEAQIRLKNQALDRFSPVRQPLENGENRENGDVSRDEARWFILRGFSSSRQ
jgi:hypothetical protein